VRPYKQFKPPPPPNQLNQLKAMLRIRIQVYPHHFGKLDPDLDPHQNGKLGPDPDPHQSDKQDPDPDSHQSEKVEALESHFRALEVPNRGRSEW
jgi:hypothetical protein